MGHAGVPQACGGAANREASNCNASQLPRFLVSALLTISGILFRKMYLQLRFVIDNLLFTMQRSYKFQLSTLKTQFMNIFMRQMCSLVGCFEISVCTISSLSYDDCCKWIKLGQF